MCSEYSSGYDMNHIIERFSDLSTYEINENDTCPVCHTPCISVKSLVSNYEEYFYTSVSCDYSPRCTECGYAECDGSC